MQPNGEVYANIAQAYSVAKRGVQQCCHLFHSLFDLTLEIKEANISTPSSSIYKYLNQQYDKILIKVLFVILLLNTEIAPCDHYKHLSIAKICFRHTTT